MARTPKRDVQLTGDKAAARAVLAARDAFNTAIAERDYAAIESALGEGCSLIAGDDADPLIGREAQMQAWRHIFDAAEDAVYAREPARIDINLEDGLAAESGRWKGGWTSEGVRVAYTGRYFGKWRSDETGVWRLEAEVFVTLKRELAQV